MEAIILAGGKGTRLKSVISKIPKPMAPVNDKPFLEYIFNYLEKYQIKRVVISVGYKWEYIRDYFGDSYHDIKIIYSIDKEFVETGGALKNALNHVKNHEVYVIHGDTFFDINMLDLKLKKESSIVISLKYMTKFNRYGSVELNSDGYVQKFIEKEYKDEGLINGGIYLLRKNIFNDFRLTNKFSFENFMENNFELLNITGMIFNSYFIDIGIPEDYEKVQHENYIKLSNNYLQ